MKTALTCLALLALAPAGWAQEDLKARSWAAGCNACHGAGGRSETSVPSLAGRSQDELFRLVMDIRQGRRSATVEQHISKGYREDELRRITAYLARQPQ